MSTLTFASPTNPAAVHPLETVTVHGPTDGTLVVRDGAGEVYFRGPSSDRHVSFMPGRGAGLHRLEWLDGDGGAVASGSMRLVPETRVADGSGQYARLHRLLVDTMLMWGPGYGEFLRIGERLYKFYVSWLRDHVHVLKGMRYYDGALLHSGIDLYADWQREDGMIWDKVKRMAHSERQFWRDHEFARGDFIRKVPGNPTRRFQRVPVENDVEYLFIEGLYRTWQATGDDQWMAGRLDHAIRAVRYATTDRYRWSETFGLLKRGFTIDSWDFQHRDDIAVSGSAMTVDPDRTTFGVMHGDNTGMMASCRYLAHMLRVAGRADEAPAFEQLADTLKQRLDETAWNGRFYRHHVSEDPGFQRDIGDTDESEQVSLSNAYALNRGIDFDQARAIIDTYRRIRDEMPASSPGEFYNLYPPFEKGFRFTWDYMNGGVSTICAGELARGAFDHGEEAYGREILDWALRQGERFNGFLLCCLRGRLPEEPERTFETVDLREHANVDLRGEAPGEGLGWLGDPANDLSQMPTGRQTFEDVPFDVIDPEANRGRAAVGLSLAEPYKPAVSLAIGRQAASLYFLHAASRPVSPVGRLVLHYTDGSHAAEYIRPGSEIEHWFMPAPNEARLDFAGGKRPRRPDGLRVAWQGPNRKFENVGVFVWGLNNPHPDRTIERVELEAAQSNAVWVVLGITLSDAPVFFPPLPFSGSIPDSWGAAAVVDALVGGLVGLRDEDRRMRTVTLSPRWACAGEDEADACITYPASGAYVAYRHRHERSRKQITLSLTGSGDVVNLRVLLPEGTGEKIAVSREGEPVRAEVATVGQSRYVTFAIEDLRPGTLQVSYESGDSP